MILNATVKSAGSLMNTYLFRSCTLHLPGVDFEKKTKILPELRQCHRHTNTCFESNLSHYRFGSAIPTMFEAKISIALDPEKPELSDSMIECKILGAFLQNKLPRGEFCT